MWKLNVKQFVGPNDTVMNNGDAIENNDAIKMKKSATKESKENMKVLWIIQKEVEYDNQRKFELYELIKQWNKIKGTWILKSIFHSHPEGW